MTEKKQRRPKGTGGLRDRNAGTGRPPNYEIAYDIKVNGVTKRKTKSGFKTKKEAQDWKNEQDRLGEDVVEPAKMTVGKLFDDFLEDKESKWKPTYFAAERSRINSRLRPALGHYRLADLDVDVVGRYFTALRNGDIGDGRIALSETSQQHVHDLLKKILKWAQKRRLVERNVVVDLDDRPKRDTKEMQVYNVAQLAQLVEELKVERYGVFFHLAAFTGMRRAELLRLVWSRVKLDEEALYIPEAKSPTGLRTVDLDAGTVAGLRRWRNNQAAERLAFGAGYQQTDAVFTNEDGSPLRATQVNSTWRRIMRNTDLPRIRFHDLRHSHASLLAGAGVPSTEIAARIGDKVTTVERFYFHAIPGRGKPTADRFAEIMAQPEGGKGSRPRESFFTVNPDTGTDLT